MLILQFVILLLIVLCFFIILCQLFGFLKVFVSYCLKKSFHEILLFEKSFDLCCFGRRVPFGHLFLFLVKRQEAIRGVNIVIVFL